MVWHLWLCGDFPLLGLSLLQSPMAFWPEQKSVGNGSFGVRHRQPTKVTSTFVSWIAIFDKREPPVDDRESWASVLITNFPPILFSPFCSYLCPYKFCQRLDTLKTYFILLLASVCLFLFFQEVVNRAYSRQNWCTQWREAVRGCECGGGALLYLIFDKCNFRGFKLHIFLEASYNGLYFLDDSFFYWFLLKPCKVSSTYYTWQCFEEWIGKWSFPDGLLIIHTYLFCLNVIHIILTSYFPGTEL